ncbi:hypothetical protein EVA_17472 [gut metagenome]|uniref:Uncharacterized protein n=1 Tax=gut metagenome TaxID=749906 RepID=J9C3M5_9ZZZZ
MSLSAPRWNRHRSISIPGRRDAIRITSTSSANDLGRRHSPSVGRGITATTRLRRTAGPISALTANLRCRDSISNTTR